MFWLLVLVACYFTPAIIAGCRHRNGAAIFALNLLLGWTFLGWVAALVWSCTDNTRPRLRRGQIIGDRQEFAVPLRRYRSGEGSAVPR